MSKATAVAMTLAKASYCSADTLPISFHSPADIVAHTAHALGNAGLRVFVEAAEVVANATWPPSESDVIKLEVTLAALTGTKVNA